MVVYTLLNIIKTPWRSIQLLLGASLVFLLILTAGAFESSMNKMLSVSGNNKNVILLGMGSEESLERSEVSPAVLSAAKSIRGLKESFGEVAVSPEVIYNANVKIENHESNAIFRGVTKSTFLVYPNLVINRGHFPRTGEVMVSPVTHQLLNTKKENLDIGKSINFEGQEFKISGHFSAPGSVMESEIWINLGDINALTQRDRYSSVTVRLDGAEFDDVDLMVKQRQDLQVSAIREVDYYNKLSSFYEPIKWITWLMAIMIAAGALFGAINSFYAAIDARKKEFATLEAIGFTTFKLYTSILLESCLIHLASYLFSATLAMIILPQISLNFGSMIFKIHIDTQQILSGLMLSIIIAIFVTLIPSIHILNSKLSTKLNH
jgi:putative ABC transport system permease protein